MIQDILTILMISGALAYTGYSIVKAFNNGKSKNSGCSGCAGCAPKTKCEKVEHLADLKNL